MRSIVRFAAVLALAVTAVPVAAQIPAGKTIHFIIPFPPGGTTDFIGRSFADQLSRVLGQPVVVENKGGAGGSIGAEAIARAAPDGLTIGMATVSTHAVNPACNPNIGYDPVRDFAPITQLAASPHVILVNPAFPASNYAEFVKLLKAEPGKYSFATSGTCGTGHMLGESFKAAASVSIVHVPYRGAGPALNDVLANHVPIMIDGLSSSMPQIVAGKLRPIVIASPARVPTLPDVPTFGDVGLSSINDPSWYGLVAPAGTSRATLVALHAAAVKALHDPALIERYRAAGADAGGNSSADYAAEIRGSYEHMKTLVATQNIHPE
ncbi:tripartite tricarboxylate transporter substrate binding protein BugE [soil metagenome]